MKASVSPTELNGALSLFSDVVKRKVGVPILSCVSIRAGGNCMTIQGTDMDRFLRVDMPCRTEAPGEFSVPLAKIAAFSGSVSSAPSIDMSLGESKALLSAPVGGLDLGLDSGSFDAVVPTRALSEMPEPPSIDFETSSALTLPAWVWSGGMMAVRRAVSTEETRYYLNGICLQRVDGKLQFTATNGHVLQTLSTGMEVPEFKQAIVPRSAVSTLLDMLSRVDPMTDITVNVAGSQISTRIGDATLVAKLIDGTFPDWKRVVPDLTAGSRVTIDPVHWGRALRAAQRVMSRDLRTVSLAFARDGIRLSFAGDDVDGAIPLSGSWRHEKLTIGFNVNYLIQAVSAESPSIEWVFGDPSSPAVACSMVSGMSLFQVVMPMRT